MRNRVKSILRGLFCVLGVGGIVTLLLQKKRSQGHIERLRTFREIYDDNDVEMELFNDE